MNRIVASAGLLALGVVAVEAAGVTAVGPTDKPWSISASLRGFYDDNYALSSENKQSSFGFEVNPKVGVNLNGQQTSFGANYSYTLRYFEDRSECVDHTHQFKTWFNHAFTERYSVNVSDELVYSQEPTLTDPSLGVIRSNGNAVRNDGQIKFHAQMTRLLEVVLGYQNVLYDYEDPNYALLLNRLEHYANIDFRWQAMPQTVAVLGYQFKVVDFVHESVGGFDPTVRNSLAHIVYVGVDHNFSPNLTATVRVGAQFTDYYNIGDDQSDISPWARVSLRYTYLPGSYLETGFSHSRNQTDVSLDQESSSLYLTLSHSFTPKFVGTFTGQAQYAQFKSVGGGGEDQSEWIYLLGLNLEYRFTPNLSANVSYNYDLIESDLDYRGYDRNRVFMGVTASY
jgi:hypothetical protein